MHIIYIYIMCIYIYIYMLYKIIENLIFLSQLSNCEAFFAMPPKMSRYILEFRLI